MQSINTDFWASMESIRLGTTPVICVAEEATMGDVARLISESGSRVVCVIREGQSVGTISDREMQAGAAALGREFGRLRAKHVMQRVTVTVNSFDDASDVIDALMLLRRTKARNAVVVKDGFPVGVISLDSLSRTGLGLAPGGRGLL